MTAPTLNILPSSSRCSSVLVTAKVANFPLNVKCMSMTEIKTEQYLQVHPLGKVPSIQTAEGNFCESLAISKYIIRKGNKALLGTNDVDQALVDQYLDTIRQDLAPALRVGYSVFGYPHITYTCEEFHDGIKNCVKALKFLDSHLRGKKFLVGSSLTLADIVLVCDLATVYRFIFTEAERKDLIHLSEYFYEMVAREEFKSVMGVFPRNDMRIFVQFSEKRNSQKIEEKKECKKEVKKEEKKPVKKEEKKQEKKEEKEDEDEFKEEKKPEVKFPDTKFNLHDFKTLITNAEDRNTSIDFLFENFDKNAFSVWFFRYDKLPSEGKKLFLTRNFLTGFLSRAEVARKHSIGSIGIYGEEGDLEVKGVWMWRGVEDLPMMKEHTQWEYFQKRQLDLSNEADKQLLRDYWTKKEEDKDVVEGLTVREWILFK